MTGARTSHDAIDAIDAVDAMRAQVALEAPPTSVFSPPGFREYAGVGVFLGLYCAGLELATRSDGAALPMQALLAPMGFLVAVTGIVCLLMVVLRNYAVISSRITGEYFTAYKRGSPPDWIERPARTFNNLMQVPTLFYVVCLFMMMLDRIDQTALTLAWIFVGTRAVHASIYMIWNYLPARFATWLASTITLAVLWLRLLGA